MHLHTCRYSQPVLLEMVACAQDQGPKQGLNGVDNGQLWFDNVRVPRDALLDK